MSNHLLSMVEVARLLNIAGVDVARRTRRRLRAIADQRGALQLFTVGRDWFTTREDIERLLPELFSHRTIDDESLRPVVEQLVAAVKALRLKVEKLENLQLQRNSQ